MVFLNVSKVKGWHRVHVFMFTITLLLANCLGIVQQRQPSSIANRRSFVRTTAEAIGVLSIPTKTNAKEDVDDVITNDDERRSYNQQFPSLFDPIYGKATNKKTIKKQITANVYILEQSLVLGPLETPIRCVVIRLKDGNLWVHNPLAPTKEFFELVESCCGSNGVISHVIIPTYALEHKIFAKDALSRWQTSQLWISPNQFNFPLRSVSNKYIWGRDLVDGVLIDSDLSKEYMQPPWIDEIQYQTLTAGTFTIGGQITSLCETAFYHKSSQSLIVTDSVAKIGSEPLESISNAENLLLISKRSTSDDMPTNTFKSRQIGWKKNALLISYFFPEHEEPDPTKFGVVTWTDGWEDNFDRLSNKLLVPPVVRSLLYNQNPRKVKEWVDIVCNRWEFHTIIPAHWDAPISTNTSEFKNCFRFLDDDCIDSFPENDLKRGLKPLADLVLNRLS